MDQPNVRKIRAVYVPKSVRIIRRDQSETTVAIAGMNIQFAIALLVSVFSFFVILPIVFFFDKGVAALIFVAIIGVPVFLAIKGPPKLTITRDGVRVGGNFYAMADIAGFRDSADDQWLTAIAPKLGGTILGLQYGIYAVSIPYLISGPEGQKITVFLTDTLKHMDLEAGAERARKIQQAEEF